MSRKLSESVKKTIAGDQSFKCNNKPGSNLKGLEKFLCPLWYKPGELAGSFDGSGYQIDHITEHCLTHDDSEENLQALCVACHSYKTRKFISKHNKTAVAPQIDGVNGNTQLDDINNYNCQEIILKGKNRGKVCNTVTEYCRNSQHIKKKKDRVNDLNTNTSSTTNNTTNLPNNIGLQFKEDIKSCRDICSNSISLLVNDSLKTGSNSDTYISASAGYYKLIHLLKDLEEKYGM